MLGVLLFGEDPDLSGTAGTAVTQHLPPCDTHYHAIPMSPGVVVSQAVSGSEEKKNIIINFLFPSKNIDCIVDCIICRFWMHAFLELLAFCFDRCKTLSEFSISTLVTNNKHCQRHNRPRVLSP